MSEIIAQGAEAILEKEGDKLLKTRLKKGYRVSEIDNSLRKSRTKREAKVLAKAKELGITVPEIISVDESKIEMEYIDGGRLRDFISSPNAKKYVKQLGEWVGILHDATIIHGDLTTSNVLVADKLYLIDFGLSFFSAKIEDKAVDLHVFEEALESTHPQEKEEMLATFLEGYNPIDKSDVLKRLEEVRSRGRNK